MCPDVVQVIGATNFSFTLQAFVPTQSVGAFPDELSRGDLFSFTLQAFVPMQYIGDGASWLVQRMLQDAPGLPGGAPPCEEPALTDKSAYPKIIVLYPNTQGT